MKAFIPILGLCLLGPVALAAEEPVREGWSARSAAVQGAQPGFALGAAEPSAQVLNPDRRCADPVVTAEGAEGEAEFRREPAGPTPPPLYFAVDISVEGCDMLLTTTGELRQLPEPAHGRARVVPAQ